tara:strand:- start:494 stop:847 length:354 start_codon:yes stop_codon:yes gene_type:complete
VFKKKGVVNMENLVKQQIIDLANKLEQYGYADETVYGWHGSLLELANYDLEIEYYTRNIYGNYSADVAAIYSQYIYLVNKNIHRDTRIQAILTTSKEDRTYKKYLSNIMKYFPQEVA